MKNRRGVASIALAMCLAFAAGRAHAQTPDEIKAARELFGDALKDEQAKHFDVALGKFQRVQKVKDTPQVRYRIASCLAGIGHLKAARDAFADIHATPGNDDEQEVERSAQAQKAQLAARVPDVAVRIAGGAVSNAIVSVDGAVVAPGQAVSVDPGEHLIVVSGNGVKRNETRAAVDEGAHLVLTVQAEPDGSVKGPDHPPPPPPHGGDTTPVTPDHGSSNKTYGYIGVGVGGALLISTIVVIALREGEVSTVKNDCPGNVCPTSKKNEVDSAKSTANTEMPLAIGLGVGAAVATGIGAYFLFKASPQTQVTAAPTANGAAVLFTRTF